MEGCGSGRLCKLRLWTLPTGMSLGDAVHQLRNLYACEVGVLLSVDQKVRLLALHGICNLHGRL